MCAYFCVLKIIPIFGTVILCTLNAAIHAEARATEILSGGRFKKRHFPRGWERLFEVILSGVPNEIAGLRKTIIYSSWSVERAIICFTTKPLVLLKSMFSLMIFYLLSACGMFVGFFFHALRDSERKFYGEGGGWGD